MFFVFVQNIFNKEGFASKVHGYANCYYPFTRWITYHKLNIFTGLEKLHRLTAADYLDWNFVFEIVKDKEDGIGSYTFVAILFNFE